MRNSFEIYRNSFSAHNLETLDPAKTLGPHLIIEGLPISSEMFYFGF